MIPATALPTYFIMSQSKYRKPSCYVAKGRNYNHAFANNISVKQDDEPSKKKPYQHVVILDELFGGKASQDGRVFRQSFAIRSYEIGSDGKLSLGSLMKHLLDVIVEHGKSTGLVSGGFCSTREMENRNLVWVLRKMQIDLERNPSWGDLIQIETCYHVSGDYAVIRDFVFRDHKTGEVLTRATSLNVLMDMQARKLSKITPEIRDELQPYSMVGDPLIDIKNSRLREMDVNNEKIIVSKAGLMPTWTDIDINQHVSNIKYLDWILQRVPPSIVEKNKVSSLILEFRKECRMGDNLQSICAFARPDGTLDQSSGTELDHLLLHEDGSTILRGKTVWKARGN